MFRIIEKGSYSRAASEGGGVAPSRVEIAKDAATFGRLWSALIGTSTPPAVDFSKETAVFLMLGRRSTGGYGVTPQRVVVKDGIATIGAEITKPPPGGIVTMAFTAPYAVVAVENRAFDRVEWVDGEEKIVARTETR